MRVPHIVPALALAALSLRPDAPFPMVEDSRSPEKTFARVRPEILFSVAGSG